MDSAEVQMNTFKITDRIGDIVVAIPKTAEVFQRHHLDYCCGGDRSLQEAVNELHLSQDDLLNELNTIARNAQASDSDCHVMTPPQLVDHIVSTHHAFLWTTLPQLSELTTTLLRVHGANHPELKVVHHLLGELKMELEAHLLTEETVQYPAIDAYFKNPSPLTLEPALAVIRKLESEHVAVGNILKELRAVTHDYTVPEDGCETYQTTYALFEKLELDIFQHIHLENNQLFPQLANLHSAL